jgi:hypothetical protein
MTTKRQFQYPAQAEAYEKIARHILVGRYARISTLDRQQAVFATLNRRDALVVSNAIFEDFDLGNGGALGSSSGIAAFNPTAVATVGAK